MGIVQEYATSGAWARDCVSMGAEIVVVDRHEWEALYGAQLVGWFRGVGEPWGFLGSDPELVEGWLRRATRRQAE